MNYIDCYRNLRKSAYTYSPNPTRGGKVGYGGVPGDTSQTYGGGYAAPKVAPQNPLETQFQEPKASVGVPSIDEAADAASKGLGDSLDAGIQPKQQHQEVPKVSQSNNTGGGSGGNFGVPATPVPQNDTDVSFNAAADKAGEALNAALNPNDTTQANDSDDISFEAAQKAEDFYKQKYSKKPIADKSNSVPKNFPGDLTAWRSLNKAQQDAYWNNVFNAQAVPVKSTAHKEVPPVVQPKPEDPAAIEKAYEEAKARDEAADMHNGKVTATQEEQDRVYDANGNPKTQNANYDELTDEELEEINMGEDPGVTPDEDRQSQQDAYNEEVAKGQDVAAQPAQDPTKPADAADKGANGSNGAGGAGAGGNPPNNNNNNSNTNSSSSSFGGMQSLFPLLFMSMMGGNGGNGGNMMGNFMQSLMMMMTMMRHGAFERLFNWGNNSGTQHVPPVSNPSVKPVAQPVTKNP